MISLLAITLFSFSASAPQDAVERCKSAVARAPDDYNEIICLNRLPVENPLQVIDQLEQDHPENPYLDLLRGNHYYKHDQPKRAETSYRKAVKRLLAAGDEPRAMLGQSNLAQLLLWRTNQVEKAEQEVQALRDMCRTTQDPVARRLGLVHWAALAADRDKNIGEAYDAIAELSPKDIKSMSKLEQRKFYYARARLSGLMLHFEAAKSDFQELGRLALQEDPPARTRHAFAINDGLALEMRGLQLSPKQLSHRSNRLEKELLEGIEAATSVKRFDLAGTSLYNLSTLYSGTKSSRQKTLGAIEKCLSLTSAAKSTRTEYAQCLGAKSRILESSDPRRALELAQESLSTLETQGQQEVRLNAWRDVMRRAWAALPRAEAIKIAEQALREIEDLRSHQRDRTARQLMFAVWAEDYAWLTSRLFALSDEEPSYIEQALNILERSRARVLLEYMPEPDPDKSDSSKQATQNSTYATLPQLQAKLESDEAMLVYQIANQKALNGDIIGGSWALLITQNKAEAIKLDLERSDLADSVSIVRDMARYDESAMHLALDGIQEQLLQPVTTQLPKGIRNLVIVADGPLHALPFFSINPNYNYTLTPSATIWSKTRLETAKLQLEPAGLSVVDPTRKAAPRPAKKPGTGQTVRDAGIDVTQPLHEGRRESKALQESLSPELRTLAGSQATTEQLVKRWKPSDNILHISAHSQVDTEIPEQSKILLSNLQKEEHGNLKVSDIYKLNLDKDVVVLAGCSTGWGNWIAGEGILSLARAFQIAGASAIVASLWPIRDREAADFFEEFYANLGKGQPITQALSAAQKTLRDRNYPPQAYEGYVVIGDGRIRFASQVSRQNWSPWNLLFAGLVPLGLIFALKGRSRPQG